MAKPYPNRRRRRPGRRPPHRPPGQHARPAWRQGFTPPGVGLLYRLALPGLRGREKRAFFNRQADTLALGLAAGAAWLGLLWGGPLGLVAGLVAGAALAARGLRAGRWYRP